MADLVGQRLGLYPKVRQMQSNSIRQSPVWLRIAAATIVVTGVLRLALLPVNALSVALAAVAVIFIWLLLRGNRIVWLILLGEAVLQLLFVPFEGPAWMAVTAAIILFCLITPQSRRFVWWKRPWLPRNRIGSTALRAYTWLEARAHYLSAKVTRDESLPLVNGKLIWRLLGAVVLLLPLEGYLSGRRQDEGHSGSFIDVLYRMVSIFSGILELVLLVLVTVAACRYVRSKWRRWSGKAPPTADQTAER
jgi:hypothetical protein